jgi:protein-tyrosine phosphatase
MNVKYFYCPTFDTFPVKKDEYQIIKNYYQKNPQAKILVNCAMGQSRSASIVWKLLVDCHDLSGEEAEIFLQKKRKISLTEKQKNNLRQFNY